MEENRLPNRATLPLGWGWGIVELSIRYRSSQIAEPGSPKYESAETRVSIWSSWRVLSTWLQVPIAAFRIDVGQVFTHPREEDIAWEVRPWIPVRPALEDFGHLLMGR